MDLQGGIINGMENKSNGTAWYQLSNHSGGLAYLAYAELAAAVSEAGGLGQITAMSLDSADALRAEIKKVKALTDKPFGVNFAIGQHGRPYAHMVEAALEEGVTVMSVTGGNPAPFFAQLENTNVKKLVLVAAKRQAQKAESLRS